MVGSGELHLLEKSKFSQTVQASVCVCVCDTERSALAQTRSRARSSCIRHACEAATRGA